MTTLLILGCTGAVGARALAVALTDARVSRVIAPTRRALPSREGLDNPVLDFTTLPDDAALWGADAVACALGTTRKLAGSQAEFRRIDHDLPLQIAELARAHGAASYALVSSVGADASSRSFYLRVKGEAERDIAACGFTSFTTVRPSGLYGGTRSRAENLGDHLAGASRAVSRLLPGRYRPVHVDRVAAALVDAALTARPGMHVRESETL